MLKFYDEFLKLLLFISCSISTKDDDLVAKFNIIFRQIAGSSQRGSLGKLKIQAQFYFPINYHIVQFTVYYIAESYAINSYLIIYSHQHNLFSEVLYVWNRLYYKACCNLTNGLRN